MFTFRVSKTLSTAMLGLPFELPTGRTGLMRERQPRSEPHG
jgi:hypothetical protein